MHELIVESYTLKHPRCAFQKAFAVLHNYVVFKPKIMHKNNNHMMNINADRNLY